MKNKTHLISITPVCESYNIEVSFIATLNELGLVELTQQEEEYYIDADHLHSMEKMIRMHRDLRVNPEGIDVIFNLLNKMDAIQNEMNTLRNRLRLYEEE